MSNKIKGFTVTLEEDISEQEAQRIITAILALRYVLAVAPIETSGGDFMNRIRIQNDLREQILSILK